MRDTILNLKPETLIIWNQVASETHHTLLLRASVLYMSSGVEEHTQTAAAAPGLASDCCMQYAFSASICNQNIIPLMSPATLTVCPLQHPLAGYCQRMEGTCLAVSFPRPQYSHCAVPCSRQTKLTASLLGHCHAVHAATTMFQMLLRDSVQTCQVINCCRPHTIFASTSHPPTYCCCCCSAAADAVLAALLLTLFWQQVLKR